MIQNPAILSKSGANLLATPAGMLRANDLLLNAALRFAPLPVGTESVRCVQCHLSSGRFPASHVVAMHRHVEFQIELGMEGEFHFSVEQENFLLRPGAALVVASQTTHAWKTRTGGYMLGFLLRGGSGVDRCLKAHTKNGALLVNTDALGAAVAGLAQAFSLQSRGP